MTIPRRKPAKPTPTPAIPECVLLIAADADETARVLGELDSLTEEKFLVEWATELASGIERLGEGGVGAVVLDLNLAGSRDTEIFDRVAQAAPDVPVLILSGADTEATARQAVQDGAEDYLVKEQADGYRLRRTVRAMIDRRAAESLALDNEIAIATLDSIGAGLLRTDLRGNVAYMNPSAEKMTGWHREDAIGRPVSDVLRLIDCTSGATVDNAVENVLRANGTALGAVCNQACKLVRRIGDELGIENRVTRVHDPSGNIIGAVMAFRDVTASRAALVEVSRLAEHDPLTGLPNRALFNDRLMQSISLAKRQGKGM